MIIKEKESSDYFCPQMLVNGLDVFANSCKGKDCMAWRWATDDNPEWVPNSMVGMTDPRKNSLFIRSKTHGYCGMAGQE